MLWLNPTILLLALCFALALEWLLGEPQRYHPLIAFGRAAKWLEHKLNIEHWGIALGSLSVMILVAIPCVFFVVLQSTVIYLAPMSWKIGLFAAVQGWALWFALGANSLIAHVRAIEAPLLANDLPAARVALSRIVSRDCSQLTNDDIAKGAIESTLENGSDAIFATLFWFALFGGVGAIAHRLANTLDAMWGYRTQRFNYFGRAAARLDDVLNFIPARLTAASYALLGNARAAMTAWRTQAPLWDSPNAGPVMAAGAGALHITLGGEAIYHGQIESRPVMGCGAPASAVDISRSIGLVQKTLVLWLLCLLLILLAH